MNNDLWSAIYQLYRLLDTGVVAERVYQTFFEQNPAVFKALGFDAAASLEKRSGNRLPYDEERGYQPEPDFICGKSAHGELVVFEIKTPVTSTLLTSRSDGQREKFKADAESYISQTTEYLEFLRGNRDAREAAREILGMPIVSTYSGMLVYGLAAHDDFPRIALLASRRIPRIEILAFDRLLELLIETFAVGRPDVITESTTNPGVTFVTTLILPATQTNQKSVIADLGQRSGSRLTIYIENQAFLVETYDEDGRQYTMCCDVPIDTPFYLKLEFSSDSSRQFSILSIDNEEVDLRHMMKGGVYAPDLSSFTLGSDLEGNDGSCVRVLLTLFLNRTLNVLERLQMQAYAENQMQHSDYCMEFAGQQFLRRNKEGHLVQEDQNLSPILRNTRTDPWFGAGT